MKFKLVIVINLSWFICTSCKEFDKQESGSNTKVLLTPRTYANIFAERRSQHRVLTKQMLKFDYAKNHKLLKVGFSKIFELLREGNETMDSQKYQPLVDGFSHTDPQLQEALTNVLENCCLSAELVMHFPEISYRIFKANLFSNWKQILNWCVELVQAFPHITDESTAQLMELLMQEVNEELRTTDFVNPYYKKPLDSLAAPVAKQRKQYKRLKKGPQLRSAPHKEL